MYCVVKVNLTKKFGEIACTGLYPNEATRIAHERNMSRIAWEEENPGYTFVTGNRRDKVRYIASHNRLVQETIRYCLEQ